MLKAVITHQGGSSLAVRLYETSTTEPEAAHEEDAVAADDENHAAEETHAEVDEGPSPIAPELKELAWGGGAFIVFAVVLRYALWPRLRKGMHDRYASIQQGFEDADRLRDDARGAVSAYETALAGVKAEAAAKVDAARQQLESERQARIAEANARIAERRSAAMAQVEAQRQAAAGQVDAAVASVAARTVELATGARPSDSDVQAAVQAVRSVGASR